MGVKKGLSVDGYNYFSDVLSGENFMSVRQINDFAKENTAEAL